MAMMVGRFSLVVGIDLGRGSAIVPSLSDRSGFTEKRCGANCNSGIDERSKNFLSGGQGLEGK